MEERFPVSVSELHDLIWKLRIRIRNLEQVIETNAEIASGKKIERPTWQVVADTTEATTEVG